MGVFDNLFAGKDLAKAAKAGDKKSTPSKRTGDYKDSFAYKQAQKAKKSRSKTPAKSGPLKSGPHKGRLPK